MAWDVKPGRLGRQSADAAHPDEEDEEASAAAAACSCWTGKIKLGKGLDCLLELVVQLVISSELDPSIILPCSCCTHERLS